MTDITPEAIAARIAKNRELVERSRMARQQRKGRPMTEPTIVTVTIQPPNEPHPYTCRIPVAGDLTNKTTRNQLLPELANIAADGFDKLFDAR